MTEQRKVSLSGDDLFGAYLFGMAIEVEDALYIIIEGKKVIRMLAKRQAIEHIVDNEQVCDFAGVVEEDHENLPKAVLDKMAKWKEEECTT